MNQISPTELLAQLKSLSTNPPGSLTEETNLRTQIHHAAQEALITFVDAPSPISRVGVAQVGVPLFIGAFKGPIERKGLPE